MFVACAVVAAALQHLLGPMGLSRCPCTRQHQVSCTVCAAFLLLGHTCVPQWCQPLSASCQNRGDKSKPFQCPGQLESKCTVGRAAAARWHAIWQYQNLPRVCFFLFVCLACSTLWLISRGPVSHAGHVGSWGASVCFGRGVRECGLLDVRLRPSWPPKISCGGLTVCRPPHRFVCTVQRCS